MLKIDIELYPFGRPEASRRLHRVIIANAGAPGLDPEWCRYHYWVWEPEATPHPGAEPHGAVEHGRADGALRLLNRVIDDYFSKQPRPTRCR